MRKGTQHLSSCIGIPLFCAHQPTRLERLPCGACAAGAVHLINLELQELSYCWPRQQSVLSYATANAALTASKSSVAPRLHW